MDRTRTYQIPGTVLCQGGIPLEVELRIEAGLLIRESGTESEYISTIRFANGSPVPSNGLYRLCYEFKGRQYGEEIRVNEGSLILAFCPQTTAPKLVNNGWLRH